MSAQDVWEFTGGTVAQRRRFRQIMTLLFANGFATVDELVTTLGVSRMTVHRDLDELHARGALTKVRGGATVARTENFESSWQYRHGLCLDLKRAISLAALDLVEPGDSIMIDPSTTGYVFSQLLRRKAPLTVVTPSLPVIAELAGGEGIDLYAIGGSFHPHFNCFMGDNANQMAARFRVDKFFMSTAAVFGRAICHSKANAIALDRALFKAAREHVLLVDSSKLGHAALHVFGDASEWDVLITDSGASSEAVEELRQYIPRVLVAEVPEADAA
ncbi:MAG: DeoR/GlpR family DNA-binding transcription regulator [Bifidobacteriaceae bacterium]|nr:DeoR/GlpR family DNA-binding transcription regulator [Bifidobacteriaceae bacterium]